MQFAEVYVSALILFFKLIFDIPEIIRLVRRPILYRRFHKSLEKTNKKSAACITLR